jgi:spore coat polysaccharide biosynthesis predicted glycosyltransferase SpsG
MKFKKIIYNIEDNPICLNKFDFLIVSHYLINSLLTKTLKKLYSTINLL